MLIWQARCKTDPLDARKLADLLRTNLLPAIWVPTPEVRARRKLLRGRAYLVRFRTSVKNRIHGHLTAENCRTAVTDLYGRAGRAWLRSVELSPMGRRQVALLLEVVDALEAHIRSLVQSLKLAPGPVGQQYQKLLRSKGKAKATVAAARTLCCSLCWCLRKAGATTGGSGSTKGWRCARCNGWARRRRQPSPR